MIDATQQHNLTIFQDCLSTAVIEKLAPQGGKRTRATKGRKNEIKPVAETNIELQSDVSELSEFIEYLAEEVFPHLPPDLRTLSYAAIQDDTSLLDKYANPLDSSILEDVLTDLPLAALDSLYTYGIVAESNSLDRFIEPILTAYIATVSAPPPEHTPSLAASRPDGCEICQREHLPLTYHHLIPRQIHAKALKRGWHKEWELAKVAWLCRACHTYVHKIASNEELARELYSVDLLLEREDICKFAAWVSTLRWKKR